MSRFFVKLAEAGTVDKRGVANFAIGYRAKRIVAEPDAPCAMVVAMLEQWSNHWEYSSDDACLKDIQRLKDFADMLEPKSSGVPVVPDAKGGG